MVAKLFESLPGAGGLRRALAGAVLAGMAMGWSAEAQAQTSMDKARALRRTSPFNLAASATKVLQANLVQCGIVNDGNVCTDVFNSPTGGGGFWPAGTTNQYIFNSGLQIAGIISPTAGFAWARDTVGAFFFDARGTQFHGTARGQIFDSLDPNDIANWPDQAVVRDGSLFNAALLGSKAISDQDTWVKYWDGDPNRLSNRKHPMGLEVTQRSLAFNAPAGAENTIFFIYEFKNISNDPEFQQLNEAKFPGLQIPDGGYTIDSIFAAFSMDPDVTTHATDNFSTAVLPFSLGVAYHAAFQTDDFNFAARPELYAPPFFQGPGFVGVKYLRSPIDPVTKREVGLSLFSNTLNAATGFPDPVGDRQLYRYLSGTANAASGDNPCNIPNPRQSKLCFLWQDPADTRFYQSSGPFSLKPGESGTIVVAYTHGAPVAVPGYTAGTRVRPGIASNTPGVGSDTLRLVERLAGWQSTPAAAIRADGSIDETKVLVVRKSVLSNALVAQTIFNNRFLLPRPPEPPVFSLVPGGNQVTVVWAPSASEKTPDPYFAIASNPDPANQLFDANYRRLDVEGYRIYRAGGLSGGFELIAQFDHTGTVMIDRTGQLDPSFVPEEGAYGQAVEHELRGKITMFPDGGRVRDKNTGSVVVVKEESIQLEDTGVPFAFIDKSVRNGITYRYIVTAFDVNSLKSGALSLESPRQVQLVVPRKDPSNLVLASFTSSVTNAAGQPLPTIAHPTVNSQTGIFSGPMPPTDGLSATFAPLVARLLPKFTLAATIDSILPYTVDTHPQGCPKGSNALGACWRMFMTFDIDGKKTVSVSEGWTPVWFQFGEEVTTEFPMGAAAVPPDPTAKAQFSLPEAFPGFQANVIGKFPQTILYSQMEGQTNRRGIAGATIYPGFATGVRMVPGGSRWFSGANETVADPTALIKVGHLNGVDTVWAPIHHTPTVPGGSQYPGSTNIQCFSYLFSDMG
ncbi:MAG: hypothetical protein HY703_09775, partial [Gemmatimonadetes bacterium]|nr:hypothetical protein [Gemmatimonadota bacterium]